ncbi:MAG: UDP-glucose 4-epimerase GalE [Actinomycetota bacterium]
MRLLVTGGAGFIGSHVVRLANEAGHSGVVIDDLSTGQSARSPWPIHRVDLADSQHTESIGQLLRDEQVDAVIHLAARKQVGESVSKPEVYYRDNIGGLANLLVAMRANGVHRLVFSSSAACYGSPDVERVSESTVAQPINPYGETKLVGEWLIRASESWGLRQVSLRYFNVAGAGWSELADTAELNLIPILIGQLRRGEKPKVFGTDYETRDGSCERDYVHVLDLARSHLLALDYLDRPEPRERIFNVGTGLGATVLEVIAELASVAGVSIDPELAGRREGDPAKLVADATLIEQELGFKAEFGLQEIINSAWNSIR